MLGGMNTCQKFGKHVEQTGHSYFCRYVYMMMYGLYKSLIEQTHSYVIKKTLRK